MCALALLMAAPAAQAAAPTPCGGAFLISDAVGDQTYKAAGNSVGAAPANTDVVGLFFRVDGDKVTANVVMEDLVLAPPSGFQAIRYRVYYTIDDIVYYLQALSTSSGVAYSWGSDVDLVATAVYAKEGDTTGAVFEGKKGVVQIVLPKEKGGTPGTKLNATSASIGLLTVGSAPEESQAPPIYFGVDTAPDANADGPSTTPASCDAPAAAGAPQPDGTPQQPAPSGGGQPSGGGAPSGGGQSNPATPFQLTLGAGKVSAKKANKSRSVTIALKCNQSASGLTVQLKRGSKVLGTGKLAKLGASGTVKLKLKGKIKKGAHKLVVTGKRTDGSAFTVSLKVKVSA